MMRKVVYNIFIALILLSMTSCGLSGVLPDNRDITMEDPPPAEMVDVPNTEPTINPTEGGELRIPLIEPDGMNPFITRSKDVLSFLGLIYEGLFVYGEDLNPEPALVESYEVSDDRKRWEFQLKKGVSWHNGSELTGQDVKYTFDLLLAQKQKPEEERTIYARRLLEDFDIARIELILNNPHGLAIVLNEPAGVSLLETLTFPILPRDGQNGETLDFVGIDFPIGTGPYRVETMAQKAGEEIRLVRNETWWGTKKPYITSIAAHIYKDNEEALKAFKGGEVDIVNTHVIFAESYSIGKDTELYRYLTHNFDYIGINHRSPGVLGDRLIREAIAYGIDRKDIITRVYANNAQAVDSPVPPDAWYYDPELRVYDYQPLKAKKLLEEAGWTKTNEDGYLQKDGKILKFTVNAHLDNVMQKEALNLITEQLKEIGIQVESSLLPWDEYLETMEKGDFQAVLGECYLETLPDLGTMFHSRERNKGFNNHIAYSSNGLDELLDRIPTIVDQKEYRNNYKEIQAHLVDELPIISLYYKTSSLVTNQRVSGVKGPRELSIYRNIDEWYLSQ